MDETRDRQQTRRAGDVAFNNNEPVKLIPRGNVRESTFIDRIRFPSVALREHLNVLLLSHCASSQIMEQLRPEHEAFLQRICTETIASGTHPTIRQKAIWALRFYPTIRSMAVLADLAEQGEDEYVRSHALRSLSFMKIELALPLFARKLEDPSPLVRRAAEQAIRETVQAFGEDSLAPLLKNDRTGKLQERLRQITEYGAEGQSGRRPSTVSANASPDSQ